MNTEQVGAIGYPPEVKIRPIERVIYEQLWDKDEYRQVAPGEGIAPTFLKIAQPKKGAEVIDFGCGTGRGGLMLAIMGGLKIKYVDFAENCLDPEIRQALTTQSHVLSFTKADLAKNIPVAAEYGFCTDVMEHIPPSQVDAVLQNILKAARHVFFQISMEDDVCGALVGHKLHLSIHPMSWWMEKLQSLGAVIHWSEDHKSHCLIYATAWATAPEIVAVGVLNTTEEIVRKHVEHNVQQGWQQVSPHETNDIEVMILGGGPSLDEHLEEIREQRAAGVRLIALNGAYEWCLKNNLRPSGLVMVDAREFNARFSHPQIEFDPALIETCRYFIASQCHPSVLEGLPKDRTYLWHTSAETIADILKKHYEVYWGIPGGSTVLLRAIPLLRLLGFKKFHLYGCDSCIVEDKHHTYSQPENDSEFVIPVEWGGRVFQCHSWMAAQAQEFVDLIRFLGNEIELSIAGDGLLAYILSKSAELQEVEEKKVLD